MPSIQYDEHVIADLRTIVTRHEDAAITAEAEAATYRATARARAEAAANARRAAAQYQQLLDHAEGKPPAPVEPDPADERAAVLAGYRQMLDFLEDNPDVPIGMYEGVTVYARGEERVAEVDRIAPVLGAEAGPRYEGDSCHAASRVFGPVMYQVIATKVYDQDAAATETGGVQ